MIKSYGEFSWMPNSVLAGVILPSIVFGTMDDIGLDCSGCYYHNEQLIMVVNDEKNQDIIPAVIAHEFRHHIQKLDGELNSIAPRFNINIPYEEALAQFYLNDLNEYEALLFEHKIAKNWCNDWQLRKIVNEDYIQ